MDISDISGNKVIKTRTGSMTWNPESKILFIELYEGAVETLDDAITNSKLGREFTEGVRYGMCLDISKMHSIKLEARNHYSKNTDPNSFGIAMITSTPISRVIGNFFIGLNKPKLPIRLFSKKNDAISWIEQKINSPVIKE